MDEDLHGRWDEYLARVNDDPVWARAYMSRLHIKTKDPQQQPIPFSQPHPLQLQAQEAYEDPEITLVVDVKGRQVGRSTQEGANQTTKCHSATGPRRVLVATNHQSTTDSSLDRYEVFSRHLPRGLASFAPMRVNKNKGVVHFDRNDAAIAHMTVGGSSEAKSWTYHEVVAEEMGKWPNARVNWASIQATLPDNLPTRIISTPTGPGTLYAEIVQNARRAVADGDQSVRVNFWAWYEHPDYYTRPPPGWEPDGAAAEYAETVGLSPETVDGRGRIYWRHQKIWGPKGMGLADFRKEYPSNIDEGFLAWEGGWFDLEWLNQVITIRQAHRNPTGELRFYRRPEAGQVYAIGVDGSWANGGDYAVASVLDAAGRLCAVLAVKHGGELEFARRVGRLAQVYNNALVLVEGNSVGKTIIRTLYNEGVNLWRDYSTGKPKDWNTNGGSREMMLSTLKSDVNAGALDIPDMQMLREMTCFREVDGRLEGQDGEHDDHVFSVGLANICRRSLPATETRKYRPVRPLSAVQQGAGAHRSIQQALSR